MASEPSFKLSDFKKWLKDQTVDESKKEKPAKKVVSRSGIIEGTQVKVQLGADKLAEHLGQCNTAQMDFGGIARSLRTYPSVVRALEGNLAHLDLLDPSQGVTTIVVPRLYLRKTSG